MYRPAWVDFGSQEGHHKEHKKMETAKIEFATSRRPSRVDAKRALYQLSYVPLGKVDPLSYIKSPGRHNLSTLVESQCYYVVIHASIRYSIQSDGEDLPGFSVPSRSGPLVA